MSDKRPTPDQQAIIDCKTDNILVPAAAGSGKTTVMIDRIVSKIIGDMRDDSIPDREKHSLDSILVVTFTVAAAEHMREKAESALDEAIAENKADPDMVAKLARQKELLPNSYIQTFDAFCARVVKEKGYCAADSAKADVFDPANIVLDGNELTLLKHSAARQAIRAMYDETGSETDPFVRLTLRFGDGRSDTSLEQTTCEIYDTLRSLPDYLNRIKAEYDQRKALESEGKLVCGEKLKAVAGDIITLLSDYARVIRSDGGVLEYLKDNETFYVLTSEKTPEARNAASVSAVEDILSLIDRQVRRHEEGVITDGLEELYLISREWNELLDFKFSYMTRSCKVFKENEELMLEYLDKAAQIKAVTRLVKGAPTKLEHPLDPPKALCTFLTGGLGAYESYEELKAEQLALQKERTEMIGAFVRLIEKTDEYYAELKTAVHGMDFADQEYAAFDILDHEDAVDFYRNKFVEIYIDEYQDNTRLQDEIISKIARPSGNVFRVGDVKQSIYKFRHAEPGIFNEKIDAYEEGREKGQVLPLTENFRSSPQILAFVNHIFEQAMTREASEVGYTAKQRLNYPENSPSADQGEEGLPRLLIVNADGAGSFDVYDEDDEDAEEEYGSYDNDTHEISSSGDDEDQPLDSKIKALCLGVEKEIRTYMSQFDPESEDYEQHYSDICVLTSIRSEAEVISEYLDSHGLPSTGRVTTSVFGDLDIRGLIGFIICLGNSLRDEYLAGVLLSPYKNTNFTVNDIAEVQAYILENAPHLTRENLINRLRVFAANAGGELAESIGAFLEDYDDLRMKAMTCDIDEIVELIFKRTEIKATVKRKEGSFDKLTILKDWLCANFKRFGCDISGIAEELEKMRIQINEDATIETSLNEKNKIVCMNFHKSKGLEYPFVIFALKDRGKSFSVGRFSFDAHAGFVLEDYDDKALARTDSIEQKVYLIDALLEENAETLRDLYVALTRAQTRLSVVTWDFLDNKRNKAIEAAVRADCLAPSDKFTRLDWLRGSGTMCCDLFMSLIRTDSDDAKLIRNTFDTDIGKLVGFKACTTKADQDPGCLPGNRGFVVELLSEQETAELDLESESHRITADDTEEAPSEDSSLFDAKGNKTFDDYVHEDETLIPFKVSVTGIRHGSMEETRHVDLEVRDASEYDNTGSGTLNAATKGTILHKLMRFIDTEALRSGSDLIAEIDKLIGMKMFEEYSADNVRKTAEEFRSGILTFASSDICKAFEQATDVGKAECEKPIVFAVPATDKSSDFALVQGKIDLMIEQDDGWVVLDYKTERSDMPDAESRAADARDKHGFQLTSYSSALEASGMKVKARYVYLVRFGEFVEV
ncbi:MAG: UvrD-helicase domain-containing protein [Clostridiales bacterium]|nr:UvrD-helicase domain-containing protein [Clostridiales bacterium]